MCNADPTHISNKLNEILESSVSGSQNNVLDKVELICSSNYDKFIQFASNSKLTFQKIYELLRDRMKLEKFPEHLQEFLELYLNDVQLKVIDVKLTTFYADNLKEAIENLDTIENGGDATELIESVRRQSYDDFVVLVTHVPKYLYLLK